MKLLVVFLSLLSLKLLAADTNCLKETADNLSSAKELSYELKEDNQARLFLSGAEADKELIILVHGFLGSPFEVIDLGNTLARNGYAVYMPLIPGFGSTTDIANETSLAEWKSMLPEVLKAFSQCTTQVHLMGFSLGGGLATDFILNNPNVTDDGEFQTENETIKINSLSLFAPFFKSRQQGLLSFSMGTFGRFLQKLNAKMLFNVSRNQDIIPILENPEYYLDSYPINSVKNVLELSKDFGMAKSNRPGQGRNRREKNTEELTINQFTTIPTFFAISKKDRTVSYNYSMKLLNHSFLGNIEKFIIEREHKARHQITLKSENPLFIEMTDSLLNFLE